MLFIIGVLALAAAAGVFALPVLLVILTIKSVRTAGRNRNRFVAEGPVDANSFEGIIAREWPT